MIPELAPPFPNFPTTPTGGRLSLDIFNVHWSPLHGGSSAALRKNSRCACTSPRYLDHLATEVTTYVQSIPDKFMS
ncbi:hypothetical protein TNCV_1632511 [Trichonephila clavipes]|nr:hypothetical protein TNCV_1632511 [Trichonephila clavipes]